jgi:hypothetical protein
MSRHPRHPRLEAWLDTGAPAAVGTHVERCERCSTHIDEIAERSPAPVGWAPALLEALEPPAALEARVAQRIEAAAAGAATLRVVFDLLGVGYETLKLLSEGEDARD